MASCLDCINNCVSCDNFEVSVNEETNVSNLIALRKQLILCKLPPEPGVSGKIADFIVGKTGTMNFFYFCFALTTLPLILPSTMPVVQYISSGYLQLIMLPLIMVAGNKRDRLKDFSSEREYRMLLVSDRIDELLESK